MIVRRFNRATGIEVKPVSIKQAAWAIARAMMKNPSRCDVAIFEENLQGGDQNATAGYCYVPDADPPSDDQDASATESAGEGAATTAA